MRGAPPPATGRRPCGAARKEAADRRLLVHYHRHRDAATRAQLVERFLPLARHLARRYRRPNEPLDDLVQVASVALVKAIDRFDPGFGTQFSTYAVPVIVGALKRYFRDSGWDLHVPREMQERVRKVDLAAGKLEDRLGRAPSGSELAAEAGLSLAEVHEAKRAACAFNTVSLDAQPGETADQVEPALAATLETKEPHYELVEYGAAIASTLDALDNRDRLILNLRYIEDLTLQQIGKRVGATEMQVSRCLKRMGVRLRAVV
jgi:RNA polymerase sigma-B factor